MAQRAALAIVLQPRNHLWVGSLADVLLKLDELRPDPEVRAAGVATVKRALELDPWRERPAVSLAQTPANTGGGSPEDVAVVEHALLFSPRHIELLRAAARLYDVRRDAARGRDLWLRLLALVPGDTEAMRATGTR